MVAVTDTRRVCDVETAELLDVILHREGFAAGDWRVECFASEGHSRRLIGHQLLKAVARDRRQLTSVEVEVDLAQSGAG